MKKIPIGRDNFYDIIEGDFYYVDKTKVIEEILEKGAYITLFPRPRRFGKSLLVSTIDYFFNVEKSKQVKENHIFKELYIEKSTYYKELELDKVENIKTYSVAFFEKKCKVM